MFGKLLKKLLHDSQEKGSWVPPGHFYSPFPNLGELKRRENKIWGEPSDELKGISLDQEKQLLLIREFQKYYGAMPFKDHRQPGLRYYFANEFYSYADAIFLYSMINHLKPSRIVEVGSGFSSCVTLDTNERFFNNSIDCVFIEPYPERLLSVLNEEDKKKINLVPSGLQGVDLEVFTSLQANDILFIDSTHVSKAGSDVNHILFEILPSLNNGVYIHFHDIFYPFEYPKKWVYEGRAWNENYILRAFLLYNQAFQIVLFSHYLYLFHRDELKKSLPLCLKNPGGNIWITKSLEA